MKKLVMTAVLIAMGATQVLATDMGKLMADNQAQTLAPKLVAETGTHTYNSSLYWSYVVQSQDDIKNVMKMLTKIMQKQKRKVVEAYTTQDGFDRRFSIDYIGEPMPENEIMASKQTYSLYDRENAKRDMMNRVKTLGKEGKVVTEYALILVEAEFGFKYYIAYQK